MSANELYGGPLDGEKLRKAPGSALVVWLGWQAHENGEVWVPLNQRTKQRAIYHMLRGRLEFIRMEKFQ